MVRITDEGSHFDAPITKVWKLVELHGEKLSEIHPEVQHPHIEMVGENQGMIRYTMEMNGQKIPVRLRTTALPPLAQVLEHLDGPLAGSKIISYYTAKGDKTAVTVIADFESPMMTPPQLEAAGREFLDRGFDQDQAYLKKMH
ncbi:MAG: hypothetical protein L3K10_04445 [Thermoplasmata archaeon]|nr:hypothetical protein [Thermoplasmata archaeon]